MLSERRRRPGDGVGSLDGEFCGEPGTAQHAVVGPGGWCEVVLGGQVFGECCEQGVSTFVAGAFGLLGQEGRLGSGRLPSLGKVQREATERDRLVLGPMRSSYPV